MLATESGACYSWGMATKKKKQAAKPRLVMISTRIPLDLHHRLKVSAVSHKLTVQEMVNTGILMVLGDL